MNGMNPDITTWSLNEKFHNYKNVVTRYANTLVEEESKIKVFRYDLEKLKKRKILLKQAITEIAEVLNQELRSKGMKPLNINMTSPYNEQVSTRGG